MNEVIENTKELKTEDTSRDAAILSAARSLAAKIRSMAGSENIEAVRNAVSELQGFVGQGSSKIQSDLSSIASTSNSSSGAAEENYRNEEVSSTQAKSQSYGRKYPSACRSHKMKKFLMNELSDESYAGANGEEIKGEKLRDDFESVAKHSMSSVEEKAFEAETEQEIEVDIEEAKKLHDSLDRLESYRAGKIMLGGGTEEEKLARIQKLHERFERAHEQTDRACDEHECEHAPPNMRHSVRQFKGENPPERQKLREILKEDVLPEVMGTKSEQQYSRDKTVEVREQSEQYSRDKPVEMRKQPEQDNVPSGHSSGLPQMPPQNRSGGYTR